MATKAVRAASSSVAPCSIVDRTNRNSRDSSSSVAGRRNARPTKRVRLFLTASRSLKSSPALSAKIVPRASSSSNALSTIASAAATYFSTSSGDIDNTSPMLSKPLPTSSDGKSSAGVKSMPTKSRTVLLYSARFRRRIVTRPGCSWSSQSNLANSASIAATAARSSRSGGRGLSSGGICRSTSIRRTFSQIS